MPEPFTTNVDVANRALQHCGASRITTFTDDSKNASSVAFVYDKLRVAELRRNVWSFATRKVILRPIDNTTMVLKPATYDPAATYVIGAIVAYLGIWYLATDAVPVATPPGSGDPWEQYFGPKTITPWDTTGTTAYFAGELVYTPANSGAIVYLSLTNVNKDVPTTVPAWSSTTTYKAGATVTYLTVVYQSTEDLNLGVTPTGSGAWIAVPGTQTDRMSGPNWLRLDAAYRSLTFVYPIGTGPRSQDATKNVFMLPYGYLKTAPQDPKQGSFSYMGAPSGGLYDDWNYEGGFITTSNVGPLMLRFVADVADVPEMDPMFCEGLSARIALEVCEDLTQSDAKLQAIGQMYKEFMTEARVVNGIETGATEPPLDDWIACRT